MTTPHLPWSSTDPADLPQGTAYPGSAFGTLLQDPSVGKFANLGGGRFPGVFFSQPAGSPLNPSMPLGFITDLFAKFTSFVAQADPATITKPQDLQGLITDFVTGLPLSALGDASNPLEQIQTNIGDMLTDLENVWDYYTGLFTTTTRIQNGINQGWIDGDESEADANIFATMRGIRTAISQTPWTRVVCTSTQTWNPPSPEEYDLKEVVVLCFAAGQNGANGESVSNQVGGLGGSGGGFSAQALHLEDFDALHVTVGTNAASTVVRADTSGGAILARAFNDTAGSTPGAWGYNPSASNGSAGGKGGNGGAPSGSTAGNKGVNTPAVEGGPGGSRGDWGAGARGSDGASVLATAQIPCGGSGGGGGGGGEQPIPFTRGSGGHGGAGGFPAGGGGGGGAQSNGNIGGGNGIGGVGAAGLCLIFYRGEAIPA